MAPTTRRETSKLSNYANPLATAIMKKNDVIAVIIIILFVLLAAVSFGIWKLVSVAKKSMSVTSGTSSSSGSTGDIVDP
ncbi:hypothetical protein BGZ61DRAFT_529754 [Ilyonectria robusta]|uniref:uncharacterized protein n=1 Tax=Ilyonectria robusta TaxID=1079257 RepID=UPI001E8DAB18|nr:uncharacterized protein BGZ61DRAFT_529754 [Ilyonectria robusta]KAH8729567.1 hypothetical protein BGZ61DRAFT_529754 [Ilyonectria robusta]